MLTVCVASVAQAGGDGHVCENIMGQEEQTNIIFKHTGI